MVLENIHVQIQAVTFEVIDPLVLIKIEKTWHQQMLAFLALKYCSEGIST